ncbi:intraflagellar transport protein 46 homolog [Selaginella moellendorffii]|uniref:intraflagellar transport protein 46 homolog n=1 Tax=Selaginella moellendorffii TaxID=88036 RepID=UPI000D1C9296|nr:intraflagellar transport protein 46 homolog [Selaginella moellendorffii]|eukprot:XP_024528584.1 intraflagellar transport protein 46 homolog [Selaginella moellendorffii]
MASSRVSGVSDFEGLLLDDEEEDDLSDVIVASQMQLSDIGAGSQESDADKTVRESSLAVPESSLEEAFGLSDKGFRDAFGFQENNSVAEGDRVLSRRSSQRTPADDSVRTEMFFQPEKDASVQSNSEEDSITSRSYPNDSLFSDFPAQKKSHPATIERNQPSKLSEEIEGLFQLIHCYKPKELELRTILKPFIPDFIPAVGGVDEFIKIPRPDGQPDFLGLKVLDERGPKQSDPAVINLQLRASSMKSNLHPLQVASVENPEKNPKKLDSWINSIKELHRSKPPPSVSYSKPMPSIDKLMQEWPVELEKILTAVELPTEKLDLDIGTFSDVCCSILDIPVYKSRIESLHVMFSLFLELKNSMPFPDEWASKR